MSYTVTYVNDIGGADSPLEAAREAFDELVNQEARAFTVTNNTTKEKFLVDLDSETVTKL